jgi:hypothetical protein
LGSRRGCARAQAGAGVSAARVATAAELGQRQCDVEDARAGQHGVGRAAARRVMTRRIVGRQEVAREMLRRCNSHVFILFKLYYQLLA